MLGNLRERIIFILKKKVYLQLSLANQRRIWNIRNWWRHRGIAYLLKENKKFHNCHLGKRCFILGNGPSLKSLDFGLLANEITFTVNQLPRNPNFPKLKTNYHFFADPVFFSLKDDAAEDLEVLDVIKNVNTVDNKPIVFYKLEAYNFIRTRHLDEILNVVYYDHYFTNMNHACKHYIDLTRPVPEVSTVVQYAIMTAVYMGFKEIYLLGCDCSGFVSAAQAKLKQAEKSLYSYEISENEKKRMEIRATKMSIKEELRMHLEWFEYYESLFKYCRRFGVKLYNATEGGLLDCLPQVKLADVMQKRALR